MSQTRTQSSLTMSPVTGTLRTRMNQMAPAWTSRSFRFAFHPWLLKTPPPPPPPEVFFYITYGRYLSTYGTVRYPVHTGNKLFLNEKMGIYVTSF